MQHEVPDIYDLRGETRQVCYRPATQRSWASTTRSNGPRFQGRGLDWGVIPVNLQETDE